MAKPRKPTCGDNKATKRKVLSKKVRFEVFKRDSFTCQYCGRSAPDVVLEVDHVSPVSKGGENDALNLLTSCKCCNAGKGARELSDNSVLQKQKDMLDELNERRLQLEMMLKWRDGLREIENHGIGRIKKEFTEKTGYVINDDKYMKGLVKEFGLNAVLDAMDTSLNNYLVGGKDGKHTQESVNKAYEYVKRICRTNSVVAQKPYMRDVYYIRGILRNRLHYCDQNTALYILERAVVAGADTSELRQYALGCRNWTEWIGTMNEYIEWLEGREL